MAPPLTPRDRQLIAFDSSAHAIVPYGHKFELHYDRPKLNVADNPPVGSFKYLVTIDGSVFLNDHLVPYEPKRCDHGPFCRCGQPRRRSIASSCSDNVTLPLCFQFLDLLSLANCRSINRRWNNQSSRPFAYQSTSYSLSKHEQWRREAISASDVDMKHASHLTMSNQLIKSLVSSFPFIESLTLDKQSHHQHLLTERSLAQVSSMPSLTELSMNQCSRAVTDRSILYLTTRLTKLRYLSVDHCDQLTNQSLLYISTSKFVHSLTQLSMSGCTKLTEVTCLKGIKLQSLQLSNTSRLFAHSFTVLEGISTLTALNLASTHITSQSFKQAFGDSFRSIRHLNLSGCADLNDDILLSLVAMPCLTVLDLSSCHSLSLHAWHRCAMTHKKFRLLRCLDVSSTALNDEALACIPKVAPLLQIISINQCTSVTSLSYLGLCPSIHTINANLCHSLVDLRGLALLKELKILRLWDCFTLTDASLMPVMSSCTSLLKLNVCCCRGLTNQTVMNWCDVNCFPSLRVLNIRFCEGMSEMDKHQLKSTRPELHLIM